MGIEQLIYGLILGVLISILIKLREGYKKPSRKGRVSLDSLFELGNVLYDNIYIQSPKKTFILKRKEGISLYDLGQIARLHHPNTLVIYIKYNKSSDPGKNSSFHIQYVSGSSFFNLLHDCVAHKLSTLKG